MSEEELFALLDRLSAKPPGIVLRDIRYMSPGQELRYLRYLLEALEDRRRPSRQVGPLYLSEL